MNGFPTVALGDVADVTKLAGYEFTKHFDYNESGEIIAIRALNLKNGLLVLDQVKRIARQVSVALPRSQLVKNDILLSYTGSIGEVAMIDVNDKFHLAPNVCRARAFEEIEPLFLFQFMRSKLFRERLEEFSVGSTQKTVPMKSIRKIELPLPDRAQQNEIINTLRPIDCKIELNRKSARTLEEMARSLYLSWFADFDPVHAKAAGLAPAHMDAHIAALFPDSFGADSLPEGWTSGCLGDVAVNPKGKADPNVIDQDTPYIGLEHVPRQSITISEWGSAADVGSTKSKMSVGQFLFGKLRPYFHKVGLVPVEGICSTDILVVESKHPRWNEFVLSVISSAELVDHVNAASTGTRMPRAKWQDLADFKITRAPDVISEAYSMAVRPMHSRILSIVHENQTLATLRDTLLPRLMSGELRIREAREQMEHAT